MRRLLKVTGITVAVVILVLVIAAVVLVAVVDPNDYKGQISAAVEQATGRQFTLDGELELKFFPVLGVSVGHAELGNAPGFGQEPFAEIQSATLSVRVLPLFSGQVEVGTVALDGLVLNLETKADGSSNWDDLVASTSEPETASAQTPSDTGGIDLNVGQIRVSDSSVHYTDASTDTEVSLANFNLKASDFGGGTAFPLATSFTLASNGLTLNADLEATVTADLANERYKVDDLRLTVDGQGADWPQDAGPVELRLDSLVADLGAGTTTVDNLQASVLGIEATASLSGHNILDKPSVSGNFDVQPFEVAPVVAALGIDLGIPDPGALKKASASARFSYDGAKGSATISDLKASVLDIVATGSVEGSNLLDAPTLAGHLTVAPFNPSSVLNVLGTDIETADPGVLKKLSIDTGFAYDAKHMGLNSMNVVLDDSTLTGSASLGADGKLRFDLVVDQINADRYLPPPAKGAPPSKSKQSGSLDEIDLPVDMLNELNAAGTLKIGKAQFSGLHLSDTTLSVSAEGGHVLIEPSTHLYGGSLAGNIKLDTQDDAVRMAFNQTLKSVSLLPLERDLLDSELASGTANIKLNLTSTGTNVGQMRRALDGDVSFAVTDGALQGIDIWYQLERAYALIEGKPLPPEPAGKPETPFSSVSATGVVNNGVLATNDLAASLHFMQINGEGSANLVDNTLDFDLIAAFESSAELKQNKLMGDLAGYKIPLSLTGTMAEPAVKPDYTSLLKQRAQREIDQKKKEAKEKLREKAKDKLREKLEDIF